MKKGMMEFVTTEELISELEARYPGGGVVICERDDRKDKEVPHTVSYLWGAIHRVAGLLYSLNTHIEHMYFKIHAVNDHLEAQETPDESEPESESEPI